MANKQETRTGERDERKKKETHACNSAPVDGANNLNNTFAALIDPLLGMRNCEGVVYDNRILGLNNQMRILGRSSSSSTTTKR